MKTALLVLIAWASCNYSVNAQGLQGTGGLNPSPRGGTSAGGPLLPGKNDSQRWACLKAQEEKLIGMPKSQVIRLFGKGGNGLKQSELVYQITEPRPRKTSKITYIELRIKFAKDTVSEYCITGVWH
ncbi:MAG: hypothetical protein R3F51_26975 [Cyanobacteriota/Melainabacteria group bacterium]